MVFGQCTGGTLYPSGVLNNPFIPQCNKSKIIYTTQVGTGTTATYTTAGTTTNQYSKVYVIAGYQYNFRSLSLGSAVQTDFITIANDATGAPLFSGLNGTSGIYWTATLTGVIRFYTHTSAGCPTTSILRSREVIMAPFQASITTINPLCPGTNTGQYTITVGPNHGWNSTSIVPPLNACNTNSAGNLTVGAALPLSYAILTNTSTNVNSGTGGSSNINAEICPQCSTVVNSNTLVNGTSTWSGTSTLTSPFTGYTYLTTTSPFPAGTNTFSAPNAGPVGTYTSPATIAGMASNQAIAVKPSGTPTQLSSYNSGCGAYMFYPTITAPPNLLFNQSGTTTYSCGGSGSVTLSATGGTAPYNISWFNQASSTIVTSPAGNEISASGGSYTIPNLPAGTYTLTLTDANGCVKTILALIINPPSPPGTPVASVTEQPNCLLSTGTITISSPASGVGISYTLTGTNPIVPSQNNVTGIFSGLSSGIYNVTTSSAEGCISPATSLTVNSQPPTPIAPTAIVTEQPTCSLSTGTITVSSPINAPGVSYTLTGINPVVPAQTNFSSVFLFLNSGIYEVTTTSIDGCVSPAISLTVDPQPLTPAEPIANVTEQPTCFLPLGTITVTSPANGAGISYTLTGTNPVVTSQTDLIGIFSGLSSGIYDVTTTSANGCTSLAVSLTINPQPITPPTPTVDTTAATCSADGIAAITNYVGPQSYIFAPSGPTVDASGAISNMLTGTSYTVIIDNGSCLSLESASFVIDPQMLTPAPPTASVVQQTTCTLSTGTIEVSIPSNGVGIVYSLTGTNPILSTQNNATGVFPTLLPGIYDITTSLNGCNSASLSLNILPQPEIFTSVVDTTICSSNLPFSMNSETFIAAGTQVAYLTSLNGCDSLVTINLTVIANVNSNFSQISPICFGDVIPPLLTTSLNGFSGTWSPAINNTDTTTYTFTPDIDQCGYTATMTIIVYPQVLLTITDTSICTGGTATLIATATPAGGSYFWSNANPTSSITVSPTLSTSYSVFYTSLNNCYATATRLLAVNPFPTLTATSATICDGEIATIVAEGLPTGGTYLWSPSGQATASINISPNTTSNYPVVYSRFGCASPQVIATVTVKPVPIITLASEVICIGEDITMTAQTTIVGGVYDWGNGNANETQTFSPLSDTTLTLSYSLNGCISPIETATITVNPFPISTFSASPLTGCIPLEVTLLADDNSNTSYSWSSDNGLTGTGAQSNLTFTSGGIYDITLIAGLNGCFTTTTMNNYVAVDNYPIASFLTSSNKFTELIQLLEFTNTSSGAASYTWDFGDGASSTEINPEHNFTDNLYGHVITLTAYSQFLCESTATIEILFNNGLIYYIPNTFTPNGDEFNQIFKPIFSNNSIDVYNYSFYIYNRWEHVIFETHDVEKGWDGLFGEDGIPVPQGTYNYKIIVKFKETDERKEFFGHINVVR